MMAQYQDIKAKYPDCFLFYRLGDFYEMFGDDAVEGSRLLGITLTARSKGENKTPMCGVPFHAAEGYIAKLTKLGKKVAICEQTSDPSEKGIVERDVIRVVTPGTTLNTNILNQKANNYVVSISLGNLNQSKGYDSYALAVADVTTGEFRVTELKSEEDLKSEITRLTPAEIVIHPEQLVYFKKFFQEFSSLHIFSHELLFDAEDVLNKHFKVKNLESFGINNKLLIIQTAATLLNYFQETQKTDLSHIKSIRSYSLQDFMPLDEATLRNLELFETIRNHQKEGSLFKIIDSTITSMGGRLLKKWLLHPLVDSSKIQLRLDAIEELFQNLSIREDLRLELKPIHDIERLLAKLTLNSGNARDLLALKESLKSLPVIHSTVVQIKATLIKNLHENLDLCKDIVVLLESSIATEPPATLREGGMVAAGYSQELDELRSISREGKKFIQNLQKKEIERTGIGSLKIKYNKVFGYYLEVSKSNLASVPEDYIRKQTLVNAERFITPELKEYEEKVLGAEDKIKEIEYKIFQEIRAKIVNEMQRLQKTARVLANLDVLASLAHTAIQNRYVKPEITSSTQLEIKNGRHPVVEKMTASGNFIPNDTSLNNEEKLIALITGPNMGGKSTYLRQVALITLLAHIGSFVPATSAKIPLVDRIFTRVGAADNLVKGQSTFMVEMQEAANILHNATEKSLVILDEIGRGTSTYDGVSIAWAITEYLHNNLSAKTLFATHYHELVSLAEGLPKARNLSIAVKETKEQGVVFLYKILSGAVDKSYGIEVAKLAGLPQEVIQKSKEILENLEEGKLEGGNKIETKAQVSIFDNEQRRQQSIKHPILEKIKEIDPNSITPIEALQQLLEFKNSI